jgi:DNA-binding LytR/AlgR family response regulator
MILNCLIIDDEPMARKVLQEYIEETDFLKLIGSAENPLKATNIINEMDPDLIFLDINMPRMSGIQFLKSSTNLPMVIMTTAYGQYALEGFEMSVVDYLLKPFSLDRFVKACSKALELKSLKQKIYISEKEHVDYFFVKCDGRIEKVLYEDLICIESMANYITLHTPKAKLIVYLTVKGMLEQLRSDKFLQVHKSYIVNVDWINAIEGNILHLGNKRINIGISFHDVVMARILKNNFLKR